MELRIEPGGTMQCIYAETIDLSKLGQLSIQRASHVEPTYQGQWMVELSPVGGPLLGPFQHRSRALEAELDWLRDHWMTR